MNNITSYLFVPASNQKNLKKSSSLVTSGSAVRIIDLEDSIKNVSSNDKTAELKREARKLLIQHFPSDNQVFQLRINDLNSSFWEEDIGLIKSLNKEIDFNTQCTGIVLSKTNSKEEIVQMKNELKDNGIKIPLIPLIETIDGMNNLSQIIQEENVESIMFGHHDYFYGKGVFPIPRSALTSELYRKTLKSIITTIRESNSQVGLIDGIYPYLYDKEGMQNACRFLYQEASDLKLGKIALNPYQVGFIESTNEWDRELQLASEDDEASKEEKKEMAQEIVKLYENRETSHLGVGRSGQMYLSPQQYNMAQRIMGDDIVEKDYEIKKHFKLR